MFQTMWKGVKFTLGVVLGMGVGLLPLIAITLWHLPTVRYVESWSTSTNLCAVSIFIIFVLFSIRFCLAGIQFLRQKNRALPVAVGMAITSICLLVPLSWPIKVMMLETPYKSPVGNAIPIVAIICCVLWWYTHYIALQRAFRH